MRCEEEGNEMSKHHYVKQNSKPMALKKEISAASVSQSVTSTVAANFENVYKNKNRNKKMYAVCIRTNAGCLPSKRKKLMTQP
jgi:hypothetical protein